MNCFKNIVAIITLCITSSMSPMAIHSPTQNKQSNANTPERPLSSAPSSYFAKATKDKLKPKKTVQSNDMESHTPPQRPSLEAPSDHTMTATVQPSDMEPTTTSSSTQPPQRPLPAIPSAEFETQDENMY
jgi:hypothetical protein